MAPTERSGIQHIVVAADFSEHPAAAVEWGGGLARSQAKLTLVHAPGLPGSAAHAVKEATGGASGPAPSEVLESARSRLADRVAHVAIGRIDSSTADAAADGAWELGAELVIAGTTKASGPLAFVQGNPAARIVEKCVCPVLTVQPEAMPGTLRCILAPVDFSGNGLFAVETAASLFRRVEAPAQLVLVHVFHSPAGLHRWGKPAELPPAIADDRRRREEKLEELAEESRRLGYDVAVSVRIGDAASEILEEARSLYRDVIAMGTHARGPLERLLLGSTTRGILLQATCPVLTVHRIEGL
jgi:nucleotide-binding universal stress UspA family protein